MSRQKKKRSRTQKRSFSGSSVAGPATVPGSSLTKAWKVEWRPGSRAAASDNQSGAPEPIRE
jgi:hypothetical protein